MKKLWNWLIGKKSTVIDFKAGMDLTDLPIATFYQGEVKLNFLLDTGSNNNIINESTLKTIQSQEINKNTVVYGMDGISHKCQYFEIPISYEGTQYTTLFMSCDMDASFGNIKKECGVTVHGILGSNFFKYNESILDFKEFKAYFKK